MISGILEIFARDVWSDVLLISYLSALNTHGQWNRILCMIRRAHFSFGGVARHTFSICRYIFNKF